MGSTIYVLIDDKKRHSGARTFLVKDEQQFKKLNEDGWGVYFSVNEFDKTRKEENVTSLRYVYADMDVAKFGDNQNREDKEKKKSKLFSAMLDYCEPTMIIDTSNGLQPIWELQNKTVNEENKIIYKKILKGIVEWSKLFGSAGDNVYDISRIIRLPNYYHKKAEPYLCKIVFKSDKKYNYEELEKLFPFQEKEYIPKKVDTYNLSLIDREIENIDFQEIIIKAFQSVGRTAEFDKQKRLVLDGRLTGTFQGKKDSGQFLASTSHEPFKGNKITAVADILSVSNKEARKWIIEQYNLNYTKLVGKEKINKQLENIAQKQKAKKDVRYTWGTRFLDTHFAIIKPTNFIVAAAKRNSGKTTFTFDMAIKNAQLGHKVLYISLEMETDDILDDFGRKYAGITIEEEYDRKIPETKMIAYNRKQDGIKTIQKLIIEGIRRNDGIGWETIVEIINKHENVDMVFIDNLDLIAGNEGENDWQRQKRLVSQMMSFCSEKQVPIILVHHYRKSIAGKDYGMDELSGSGKIGDGADRVIKVVRNTDPEALYPDKFKSTIYLQKGRGYPEFTTDIYFIKGTFVDTPPSFDEYNNNQPKLTNEETKEIYNIFNAI